MVTLKKISAPWRRPQDRLRDLRNRGRFPSVLLAVALGFIQRAGEIS